MSDNHQRHDAAFVDNSRKTRILSVALGLVTGLQAVTMFFSMRDLTAGGGAESLAIPLGAGIVIGVAFWVAWHWLMRVGPHSNVVTNRVMYVGLACLLTATAICTTSWFVASTIGGSQALQKHMHVYMQKVDEQLGILTKNAAAEYEIRGRVSEITAAWTLRAEQEEAGQVSGTKGCGKLCAVYKGAAASYGANLAEVDRIADQFKTEKAKAEKMRTDMNRIAAGDTTAGGQTKFIDLAAQLSQQVAKMDALTALDRVSTGGIVDVGTSNAQTTVKNENLSKELKERAKAIKEARIPLPSLIYETMTKPAATLEYASTVPGAWLLGVTFDLLPLILFLMLMLAYSETRGLAHREEVELPKRKLSLVPENWSQMHPAE